MGGQNLVQSSLVGVRLEREPLGGQSGLNVPLPFSEVFSFSISLIHSRAWPSFPSFPSEKVGTRPLSSLKLCLPPPFLPLHQLRGVPIHSLRGLRSIYSQLESLVCSRSIQALEVRV